MKRPTTIAVQIGKVVIGGGHPIAIQSMTNTRSEDISATVSQLKELADEGAELLRLTIPTPEAAKAVPHIKEKLVKSGYELPLIGDFHFNGHLLLSRYPSCAEALDKYRINPGNLGTREKHDKHFSSIIETALVHQKPIRIGVNFGSLDQELLTHLMELNGNTEKEKTARKVVIKTMVESALRSADFAEKMGMASDRIVLSVKMSAVNEMVEAYELLHEACRKRKKMYPLHLGLTEAGAGIQGIVSSSAALGILLKQGIGDTIRMSLTTSKNHDRSEEVKVCKALLQSLELGSFAPKVVSCPGCGRTNTTHFQELAKKIEKFLEAKNATWKKTLPGVEKMKVAVMGCIVNGPGESKDADIGISLPGNVEKPFAVVYKNGKEFETLSGKNIASQFLKILENYVHDRYRP